MLQTVKAVLPTALPEEKPGEYYLQGTELVLETFCWLGSSSPRNMLSESMQRAGGQWRDISTLRR